MPPITIRGGLQGELLTANPIVNSGFGRYLKGVPAQILAGADFAGQLRQPLHLVHPGQSGFALSFKKGVPLASGADGATRELEISAGAKALVTVHNRSGENLVGDAFLGDPVTVPPGSAYVSFLSEADVSADLSEHLGKLTFGFGIGTGIELRCFHPFDLLDHPPQLADAVRTVLEEFVIPGDVTDLRNMPEGVLASVSGHGRFRIGASVDFAAAFNPLASIDTIPRFGPLEISAGASLQVGIEASVAGDYQVRVHKTAANKVRLSYHKATAREFSVNLEAAAGPEAALGNRDLVKMFLSRGSKAPDLDIEQLVAAGLSNEQIDQIGGAIRAGVRRALNLSLNAEFSSFRGDDAVFVYDIDLARLDATGEAAIEQALGGDLTALNGLEPDLPGHGIRLLRSRLENLRRKRVTWRVNLLGIVNVLSLAELVTKGTVFHDEESGELIIADEISMKRIGAVTDRDSVRKVLYECAMLTATYKAGGIDRNVELSASNSFFAMERNANRERVSDYLDAVVGIGLMRPADVPGSLGDAREFGKTSFLLDSQFDQAACEALFLDGNKKAHPESFYERLGREAVLALIRPDESDAFRRIPMQSDELWDKMRKTGQPGFASILPPPISDAARIGAVRADYTLIVWWADAMHTAAEQLAKMQEFLSTADPAKLDENTGFKRRRTALQQKMAEAIQKNRSNFGDPWGLLALTAAAGGKASSSAILVSAKLSLVLPEE